MAKLTRTVLTAALALSALALVAAGCGSSSSSSSTGGNQGVNRPRGGGGLNGVALGNCLIDENWLVQPNETYIDGQTPSGSNFHIGFYGTAAAAKKNAIGKKGAQPIDKLVVTYSADKSPYKAGAPIPKADVKANATIKSCVKKVNAGEY